MSTMERILRLMADKKASDIYLSAHSPALIKINGQALPINSQVLPPDAPLNLLAEVLPPDRIEELKELGELNMGFLLAGNALVVLFLLLLVLRKVYGDDWEGLYAVRAGLVG